MLLYVDVFDTSDAAYDFATDADNDAITNAIADAVVSNSL